MKNSLFFLTLLFSCFSVLSQDLIVTTDNDSINCKITKVKPDNIYFTFKQGNEYNSTLIPVSKVKSHRFEYFQQNIVPEEKLIGYQNFPHLRLGVSGGFSYITAKVGESVPTDFVDYIKELKSGKNFGGDLTYYFAEQFGFGMKYYLFKSSNSIDNIYVDDNEGNRRYGKMSDKITTSFIGPAFSIRLFNRDKSNAFLMNLSIGYMGYSNNKVIIDNYKMTANTFGSSLDIGYDLGLTENLSLAFQISLLAGTLIEYEWEDGTSKETIKLEKGDYESLNRVDLSIGLRFNK